MAASFRPLEACIGGLFIGAACGAYMLIAGRIAGNSGALKSCLLGPREASKTAFIGGLIGGGVLMKALLPSCFEAIVPLPLLQVSVAGLCVGVGTALGNGCTSGHGLCGLSRLSKRSLVAVPTFMAAAIVTSTVMSGGRVGTPLPVAQTPQATLEVALRLAVGLACALPACKLLSGRAKEIYTGLWSGACFAVGLSIGGMVRPSVISQALSPAAFDGTLWVLFVTALALTFATYRAAAHVGVSAASVWGAASPAAVDPALVAGAALFGVGWGLSGLCPGPHIVGLAAAPTDPTLLLMLGFVCTGMLGARRLGRATGLVAHDASTEVATAREVRRALGDPRRLVIDLRPLARDEAVGGRFEGVVGALSAPWERAGGAMSTKNLPKDKAQPVLLYCRSGGRAMRAAALLKAQGYTDLVNAGGPAGGHAAWAALGETCGLHSHRLGLFWQLFDGLAPQGGGSSTYTYIIGDAATGEAIIVDPVLEQVDRDLAILSKHGLRLTLALNTHCHADHVTGTGALKRKVPVTSVISAASGAQADRHVTGGEEIIWAGGTRKLTVLGTPGHTKGCVSYHDDSLGLVLTGDALFINGCGRTDFQEGSAATLFESVTSRIFSLADHTLVCPAHDYSDRRYSTVQAERETNARFTLGKEGFVTHMAGLGLPYPKKIDVALPANLRCGLDD